jgi:hypothetical protein
MAGVTYSQIAKIRPAILWRFLATLPKFQGMTLDLTPYVSSISSGGVQIATEDEHVAGIMASFPTHGTVDDVTITFVEDSSYSITSYLEIWRNTVLSNNGDFGLPYDYQKTITLEPLDETGKVKAIYKFINCYPVSRHALEYSGESTALAKVSATFKVSEFIFLPKEFKL